MCRTLCGVAAGLALMAYGAAASGQTTSSSPAPVDRETDISGSVDVTYDSNVARSDRESAAARHISLSDELFTPNVDFVLARPVGRQVLFLQGNAGYVFHRRNTILNREYVDLNGGANAHYLSCQELATGHFGAEQSDLQDLQAVVTKNTVETESVSLAANCGRATGLAPNASVSESWRSNSDSSLIANNNRVFSATGSLAYGRPALGSISLFGSFSHASFPHQVIGTSGATYGYDNYAGGLSLDRHLGSRIEGTASLSYTSLHPNTPSSKGFSGVTYSLDGAYHMSTRISFHALASRSTTPSTIVGGTYSVLQAFQGEVSYQAGSKLFFSLTGQHSSQDYQGTSGPNVQGVSHSTTNSVYADASYRIGRRFKVALNLGDTEHSADVAASSYSETRVGLTFSASY